MVVVERINSITLGRKQIQKKAGKGKQLFHFFQENKGKSGYEKTKTIVLAILTNLWFQKKRINTCKYKKRYEQYYWNVTEFWAW